MKDNILKVHHGKLGDEALEEGKDKKRIKEKK